MAAAAINKVYVTDGAGSGTFQKITSSQLDATSGGNAFGSNYLHVQDQKASGTAGGTFTSGAWRTRTLNTSLQNNITGASLASSQITLPAGTYYAEGWAGGREIGVHQVKLYDVTSATDLVLGVQECATSGTTSIYSCSRVAGWFTLAGVKLVELRHRCTTTRSTDGFGMTHGFGTEVYADVKVWKIS